MLSKNEFALLDSAITREVSRLKRQAAPFKEVADRIQADYTSLSAKLRGMVDETSSGQKK